MGGFADWFLVAICACCGAAAITGAAALKSDPKAASRLLLAAKGLIFIAAGLSIAVLDLLIRAFLSDDFSISAVAQHSSQGLAFAYKVAAVWAGPPGSLLLWSVCTVVVFALWLVTLKSDGSAFNAAAMIIGAIICLGFALVVVLVAKPFAPSLQKPADGAGLQPALQNSWLLVHPPAFFIAYSALLVPFVVVVASVFTECSEDATFYRSLRKWLLAGIGFLALGIVTGARWAYTQAGWGGYWAWDPLQNLSLVPLLCAVVALHSLNATGLGDRFRLWTLATGPLPFVACLFVGFVASSDLFRSVHSFGWSTIAGGLLSLGISSLLLWLLCMAKTLGAGSTIPRPESAVGLEKGRILSWANVGFAGTAAVIGTAALLPGILRAVTSSTALSVPTGSFCRSVLSLVAVGLLFVLGLYMAIDLAHRPGGSFLPALAGCAVGILCLGILLRVTALPLLTSLTCGLGLFSFVEGLIRLVHCLRTHAKIGGNIAHIGVVLLVVAARLAAGQQSIRTPLREGARVMLGGWQLEYESFKTQDAGGAEKAGPNIVVSKGHTSVTLWPHRETRSFARRAMTRSRAAVAAGLLEDIVITFDGERPDGQVVITASRRPFMFWVWFGAVLTLAGTALAVFEAGCPISPAPVNRRQPSPYEQTG